MCVWNNLKENVWNIDWFNQIFVLNDKTESDLYVPVFIAFLGKPKATL